jgi:hypothetical protein
MIGLVMFDIYQVLVSGISISALITSVYVALRQDVTYKLIRHDSVVEKPIKSRIALEVSHPDKPIKKCQVFYNGTALRCDETNQDWATTFAQGSALYRIPLGQENDEAVIKVKNGWHNLGKTKLRYVEKPQSHVCVVF